MKEYLKLQEGKARKKAYKDKQKALRLAAGKPADDRHAHSLSPSSLSSQSDLGEMVPSPFVYESGDRSNIDNVSNLSVKLGDGNISSSKDQFACNPSATPLPIGDSGYVGQGSVVPCGVKPIASKGNVDPAPWMVAGEIPSHTV